MGDVQEIVNKRKKVMTSKKHRDLFEQVKSYAYDYMDNACERAVFPTEDAINRLDWDVNLKGLFSAPKIR
jgi:hypothetical protein